MPPKSTAASQEGFSPLHVLSSQSWHLLVDGETEVLIGKLRHCRLWWPCSPISCSVPSQTGSALPRPPYTDLVAGLAGPSSPCSVCAGSNWRALVSLGYQRIASFHSVFFAQWQRGADIAPCSNSQELLLPPEKGPEEQRLHSGVVTVGTERDPGVNGGAGGNWTWPLCWLWIWEGRSQQVVGATGRGQLAQCGTADHPPSIPADLLP